MIDLNSSTYNGKFITRDEVLKFVSEEQIFVRYIGDEFLTQRCIQSPLREDNIPSFSVFQGNKTGMIMWRDFATKESGDCFVLVKRLFLLKDYFEAVRLVARDFNIANFDDLPSFRESTLNSQDIKVVKLERNEVNLQVRYRTSKKYDHDYWKSFGIIPEILKQYHVYPVDIIFYNDWAIQADKYCYAYLEYKDGKPTYKVYQPFNKAHKFTNNNDYSVWEGWVQLPDSGDRLIITSSRKDVMSIVSTAKIPSIALQSESVFPKEHVLNQLKERFKYIYLLYDNDLQASDNWGIKFGKKLAEEFDLQHIWIPDSYASKDYSDLVKNHGADTAIKVLWELIS
jgi:hypothetical protein